MMFSIPETPLDKSAIFVTYPTQTKLPIIPCPRPVAVNRRGLRVATKGVQLKPRPVARTWEIRPRSGSGHCSRPWFAVEVNKPQ